MDHVKKVQEFGLYTQLKHSSVSFMNEMVSKASEIAMHYPKTTWLLQVLSPDELQVSVGHSSAQSTQLLRYLFGRICSHILDNKCSAFNVTKHPHMPLTAIDTIAQQFNLPDLCGVKT